MNILEMILNAQNGQAAASLGRQVGLDEQQARAAISQLLPAVTGGIKRNLQQPDGMDSLVSALSRGGHERYYDDPAAMSSDDTVVDGNAILGHVLGSKAASREAAQQAASNTGIDPSILQKMLPIVASVAMGAMKKQAGNSGLLGGLSSFSGGSGGAGDLLGSFLDSDGDGSVVDDLLGMAGKFMR